MPTKKEEWEVKFEEYRDTLISLGAKIKNETALKIAFKIYKDEKRIPEHIYQNCVDETNNITHENPKQTSPKNDNTTPAKASTSKKDKPKRLNSFDALADIRLSDASTQQIENPSSKEKEKEKENKKEKEKIQKSKPRKTQRERFEEYKNRLLEKGIAINDENALWEMFRSIRGRLDYKQIKEFVTFPERKPRNTPNNSNKRFENKNDEKNKDSNHKNQNQSKINNENQKKTDKTPFEEYRENLIAQGYEITNLKILAKLFIKGKGFIPPEQLSNLVRKTENKYQASVNNNLVPVSKEETLPAVVEGSFADKWIKPLREHCQKDLDHNGHPKRIVTAVKSDQNSVVIDITPSDTYAAEHPQDNGARYNFEKTDNNGNIKIDLASKDGSPLNYEYFRMMMEANRKNGIKVIAFKDIQTDEFRDKLLAAALEFDMKVQGAPQKVNINAPYLKTLPSNVKIKLGIYNGDITPKNAQEIKKNIQKQTTKPSKDVKEINKRMLALPAHISPREIG